MIQNAQFRGRANGSTVGGKGVISKAPNKPGRKPLGEISNSNSLKPPQNHAPHKQQTPVYFTYLGDEKGVTKSTLPNNRKKSVSKPVKNATTGARRPLGDISNSSKPVLPKISETTKVKNAKILEMSDPGIGDEGFLHNHAECIKCQRKDVDMEYFFDTIGLCKDSSLNMILPLHSVTEEEMDLHKEISELLYEECSPLSCKIERALNCTPHCTTPKSPSLYMQWGNDNALDFSLADTPRVPPKDLEHKSDSSCPLRKLHQF